MDRFNETGKEISIDNGLPSYLGFSPDGKRFLCCTSSGYGYLFSYPELEILQKKPLNTKGINEAATKCHIFTFTNSCTCKSKSKLTPEQEAEIQLEMDLIEATIEARKRNNLSQRLPKARR